MTQVWEVPAVRAGLAGQAAALAGLTDAGASLVGWKVGVGAPAAMRTAGITAPLVGYLTSRTVLEDGARVPLPGWTRPVLEPELAIHLRADVPGDAAAEQAGEAIGALGPAIELADVDAELADLTRVVAGDIFHRGVILGDADPARAGGRVEGLEVTVTKGGAVVARTADVTALTASPVDTVLHVARWLAATGRALRSGQVVIAGSVVPAVAVEAGDEVEYGCAPLGTLRVSFTG
jgi:2-keto-4-pentenoate hydratase